MPHQCTDCGRTFDDGSKEMLSGCPDCGGNKFQFLPASAVSEGAGPETGGSASAEMARSTGGTAPKKAPEDSARSSDSSSSARSSGSSSSARSSHSARSSSSPRAHASRSRDASEASPATADAPAGPETGGEVETGSEVETGGEDSKSAVDRAAATVRDWVRSGSDSEDAEDSRGDQGAVRDDGRRDDGRRNGDRRETRQRTDSTRNAAPEDAAQANARSDVVTEAELPEASETASSANYGETPNDGEVVDTPDEESPGLKELREELNSQFESIRIVEPGQYELNLMELYEREEYIIALKEDGKYVIEVPDGWKTPER